jgi:hypothetical protein
MFDVARLTYIWKLTVQTTRTSSSSIKSCLPIHGDQSSCSTNVMSWHAVSSYFINSPKPLFVGLKLLTVAEAAGDVIPNSDQLRLCKNSTRTHCALLKPAVGRLGVGLFSVAS